MSINTETRIILKRVGGYRYILIIFVVGGLVGAFLRANSYVAQYSTFIEVCSNGIAYVPLDTKYVKCNGIVRKVLGFTKTATDEEDPCKCPNCCEGKCYVIVTSDPRLEFGLEPGENSTFPDVEYFRESGSLDSYILWLSC